ncbi:MAG: hypothetical protein JHD16_04550 [Solirubrobacteraceae bacterium]|nr:hypothetical protein [Solirubrobacteraceae bacterium]
MSTATASHHSLPSRKAAGAATKAAPTAVAQVRTQAESDARDTRLLLAISGAATLIILVFFLGMMLWLSSFGAAS